MPIQVTILASLSNTNVGGDLEATMHVPCTGSLNAIHFFHAINHNNAIMDIHCFLHAIFFPSFLRNSNYPFQEREALIPITLSHKLLSYDQTP